MCGSCASDVGGARAACRGRRGRIQCSSCNGGWSRSAVQVAVANAVLVVLVCGVERTAQFKEEWDIYGLSRRGVRAGHNLTKQKKRFF